AGTGIKAGSSTRKILELAGVKNILSKRMGSNNRVNLAKATIKGLLMLSEKVNPDDIRAKAENKRPHVKPDQKKPTVSAVKNENSEAIPKDEKTETQE
ncbi:MAG: hypothetical protein U1C97_03245, partial [Candidatus Gracilibacteria bacterium]|nr:hypothetical protein [Candidatus Gracilibacteria bacterium]